MTRLANQAERDEHRRRRAEQGSTTRFVATTTPGGLPVVHGRASTYENHGCRCDPCTDAKRERQVRQREQRRTMPPTKIPHGTTTGYGEYGCRCADCRKAHADDMRAWRQRRAES